jgi:HPt (histidine-containing phosphotransfer) domain-containing protein
MKSPAEHDARTDASLSRALDGLWERFLPEIRERVTLIEAAARDFAAEKLTGELREAAQAAAHKLAGVLGTFGLTRGTELARDLELTFASESVRVPGSNESIAARVAELRGLIENRKPSA